MQKTPLQRKMDRLNKAKHFVTHSNLFYKDDEDENSLYVALTKHFTKLLKDYEDLCPNSEFYIGKVMDNLTFQYALFGSDSFKAIDNQELKQLFSSSFPLHMPAKLLKKYNLEKYNPKFTLLKFNVSELKKDQVVFHIEVTIDLLQTYVIKPVNSYRPKKPTPTQVTRREYNNMDMREQFEFEIGHGTIIEDGTCERCGLMHYVLDCPVVLAEEALEKKARKEKQNYEIEQDKLWVEKHFQPTRTASNMDEISEFIKYVSYFDLYIGSESYSWSYEHGINIGMSPLGRFLCRLRK